MSENAKDRVIAHFDLDAFYVAAERELNPSLVHRPVAVSQYNPHGKLIETHSSKVDERLVARPPHNGKIVGPDSNGSMIAVSYEARASGVQRGDRGMDAIKKCHDLHIVQVPVKRGKADLTMYRNASSRVMEILITTILSSTGNDDQKRSHIKVEKASIDEIYIDMTLPATQMMAHIVDFQQHELFLQTKTNYNTQSQKQAYYNKFKDAKKYPPGKRGADLWSDIIRSNAISGCTTVGGIEVMSDAALAANRLSKIELRKGSRLQVLDSTSKGSNSTTVLDVGSQAWWDRSLLEWSNMEISLACGSALAAKARAAVQAKFRIENKGVSSDVFTLSGGVSSNKTLAKLASGLKKPNRQTIINSADEHALATLFHPLPIARIRGLGGKFGNKICEVLGVKTVGDLLRVPLTQIKAAFPPLVDDDTPTAQFLYNIARGKCTEEVFERTMDKSMSSGKTFRGPLAFPASNSKLVSRSVTDLCGGLIERLEEDQLDNNRSPTLMILSAKVNDVQSNSISRSSKAPTNFHDYIHVAMKLFYQLVPSKSNDLIFGLTVSATNFIPIARGESSITAAFKRAKGQKAVYIAKTEPKTSRSSSSPKMNNKKRPLLESWSNVSKKRDLEERKTNEKSGIEVSSIEREGVTYSKSHLQGDFVISASSDNAVDKEVLSQLPSSIQSEIRLASMLNIGKGSKKIRAKNLSMNHWLSRSDKAMLPAASTGQNKKSNCSIEKDSSMASIGITYAQIDQSVMAELPHDIQMMVRKEIQISSKMRKPSVKRLDTFFAKNHRIDG